MKVGLIRHFKVNSTQHKFMSEKLLQNGQIYNMSENNLE